MANKNNQYVRRDLETRAGLTPVEKELPFSITTTDVENYLQTKFDVVSAREGDSGINVRVYTTEPSKKFLPFVVLLPLDVLKSSNDDKKKKKNDDDVPSVFTRDKEESNRSCSMKDSYYNIVGAYTYNKNDESAFFSKDWRERLEIRREVSPILKSLREPKVTSMNNGEVKLVTLMIDPIRVFHDMLNIDGDNRTFRVCVNNTQKMQSGEYRYNVSRVINKGKGGKKYRDAFAEEINRKVKGYR